MAERARRRAGDQTEVLSPGRGSRRGLLDHPLRPLSRWLNFDGRDAARIVGSMTSGVVYFACILAMSSSRLTTSLACGR